MYVDDAADALVFLMRSYSGEDHVNIGVGTDVTIRELAEMIARIVGVESRLRFDTGKPDGMPASSGFQSYPRHGLGAEDETGGWAAAGLYLIH